jgi:hypothetical protein
MPRYHYSFISSLRLERYVEIFGLDSESDPNTKAILIAKNIGEGRREYMQEVICDEILKVCDGNGEPIGPNLL